MKKIFFLTFSLLVTAFMYQGCTPVDNTHAMMQADSTANARLMVLRDSMQLACMTDVMNAAKMRSDSMMMAMQGKGKGSKAKPTPPPAPPAPNTGKKGAEGEKNLGKKGANDSIPKNLGKKGTPPKN